MHEEAEDFWKDCIASKDTTISKTNNQSIDESNSKKQNKIDVINKLKTDILDNMNNKKDLNEKWMLKNKASLIIKKKNKSISNDSMEKSSLKRDKSYYTKNDGSNNNSLIFSNNEKEVASEIKKSKSQSNLKELNDRIRHKNTTNPLKKSNSVLNFEEKKSLVPLLKSYLFKKKKIRIKAKKLLNIKAV